MIYTLTLNPSLDYIMTLDDLQIGKTNRSVSELIYPGGKGINVSIVLKNLGFENKALGFEAGFTGIALKSMVKEMGVDASFIRIEEGNTRINVKLRGIDETEINGQGPNITKENIEELMAKLEELNKDDFLIISGAIPKHLPQTIYSDILNRIGNRIGGFIVDATNELLLNTLPYGPFMIKPNIHELEELAQMELNTVDEIEKAAKVLQDKGAKNVLVSMGKDGAFLLDENGTSHHHAAPKGVLKNSVGAGDSMVAGFLAGYLENHDYSKAFAYGVCTGSASAFSENLATRQEVEALLNDF
ncbi:MAG: 1-phosphofructokinase [Ileibacterium sp.]|nr:1-phosphofructokinase [Ileibacterium sp.]